MAYIKTTILEPLYHNELARSTTVRIKRREPKIPYSLTT